MDFNQTIREKLPDIINRVIERLNKYSENYQITNHYIEIDDSGLLDMGTYVTTYSTCAVLVTVSYELNNSEWRDFSFEVPRMINGLFIIGGKYKLLNRYITSDNTCIRNGRYFNFYYGFSLNIETQKFTLVDADEDINEELTFEELEKNYPEYLVLDEKSLWKLKIIYDLPKVPEKLTSDLVDCILNNPPKVDDALNKRIISIEDILINTLKRSLKDIVKATSHNFYTYGTISSYAFQGLIDKIFYNQGSNWNTINSATNVNPYSLDSVNQKVIIEDYTIGKKSYSQEFNESYMDIIDPIVTPDSKNVGRINFLNNSTRVKEGVIYIKVLNSSFKEEFIPYYKYLGSKVLIYTCVDFDTHELKKPFIVRENRKEFKSDTFDYIECHPDERLCGLTRAIPMVNFTDTVRLSMAARMITQAVPLINPERPQIMSGHEFDINNSVTSIKYESNKEGEVVAVDAKTVSVLCDGVISDFKVPTPNIGMYNLTTVYEPVVKVGDKVGKGSTLITERNSRSGSTDLGLDAFVAFMPYRGYNYEDGIIISQSFAERLAYYTIEDINFFIKEGEILQSILPEGSKVKTGDIVVKVLTDLSNKKIKKLLTTVTSNESDLTPRALRVPNNIEEAHIIDIKYSYDEYKKWSSQKDKYVLELDEDSKKVLDDSRYKSLKLPDDIPSSFRSEIIEVPSYEGYSACITVRLLVKNIGRVGTKLANLYGAKGLVSQVLPDDQMIRTKEGRVIDCILNSDAVFARKNPSQLAIIDLSNIASKILQLGREQGNLKFKELCSKYGLKQYVNLSDDEITSLLKDPNTKLHYITGSYSNISMKEILDWKEELDVTSKYSLIDGKTKRPIRNPISCGTMHMIMLFKIPEHDNKVFTEESLGDPILGKGYLRKGGGMSIGEMELNGLYASDLDEVIYKVRNKFSFSDAQNLYINLALAGLTVGPKEDTIEDKLQLLKEKFNDK